MAKVFNIILIIIFMVGALFPVHAQVEFLVHERNMLHQSVFNQGSLGQIFQAYDWMPAIEQPSLEWPPYSSNVINDLIYAGQHNSPGNSLWIAATMNEDLDGDGELDRRIAPGGGAGIHTGQVIPVISSGWIFPLELTKVTNYPLLENGDINPDYDPNEAEEIITSKWTTWIGITVTRVSRVWSFTDFDDMIIYEITFENTGNADYDTETIEYPDYTYKDVTVFFKECFNPSMFGYWRHYSGRMSNRWGGAGGAGDIQYYKDHDYWLEFVMDGATSKNKNLAGKPEPNPERFRKWSLNSHNGGGMLSHQAVGYCILHYNYDQLANVYPPDENGDEVPENESEFFEFLRLHPVDSTYTQLDMDTHKLKQPLMIFNHDDNVGSEDAWYEGWMYPCRVCMPWVDEIMYEGHPALPARNTEDWIGRPVVRQDPEQRHPITVGNVFGPYTLKPGQKFKINYAEVIGYGGAEGKEVACGPESSWKSKIPTMDRKLVSAESGEVLTQHYLTDYGYPDHINSKVINIQQVAHKAWEAYLGQEIPFDESYSGPAAGVSLRPKETLPNGTYTIPIPHPAPKITVENTTLAKASISWNRNVEDFASYFGIEDRMTGALAKYKVYRSVDRQGWDIVDSLEVGDVETDGTFAGLYNVIDMDSVVVIGNTLYYAVTAVDDKGNESGKTNITSINININSAEHLGKVVVVPNPFYMSSGFSGEGDVDNQIGFYGLTSRATIRIYSMAGQLVATLKHDSPSYSNEPKFFQITNNNQRMASGVYFFVVTNENGEKSKGKFVVIK